MNKVISKTPQQTVIALGVLVIAALLAWLAPLFVVVWSTLILGAPHILSDLRYLVLKPRLLREPLFYIIIVPTLVLAAAFFGLRATSIGALLLIWVSPGERQRKFLVTVVVVPILVWALWAPRLADFTFVYAHNLIAVVIWWLWQPARGINSKIFVGILVSVLLILPWLPQNPLGLSWGLSNVTALQITSTLAATVIVDKLVRVFCFMQAMHFLMWLYLIPADNHDASHQYQPALKKIVQDCGLPLVVATALVSIALIAWGVNDPHAARLGYLRLAGFHGHLEILILCLFFTKGRTHAFGLA